MWVFFVNWGFLFKFSCFFLVWYFWKIMAPRTFDRTNILEKRCNKTLILSNRNLRWLRPNWVDLLRAIKWLVKWHIILKKKIYSIHSVIYLKRSSTKSEKCIAKHKCGAKVLPMLACEMIAIVTFIFRFYDEYDRQADVCWMHLV